MKLILVFLLFSIYALHNIAQDRALIMRDAVVMNITGGAALTIDQSSANAITMSGSANGVIRSEGQWNRVAWIIRTSTGSYTIPFGLTTADRFPLTYQVTSAGTGNGALIASTYGTSWDNLPLPTVPPAVTNTGAILIGGAFQERRQFVMDRYWVLRDTDMPWTTKPSSTLTFQYRDIEHSQASNTITESNLRAQYWNANQWNPGWYTGLPLLGTINTATNTLSSVNAGLNGNLFTWILVDQTNPLPVELMYFNATCDENGTVLEWMTASETNNSHFIIEKSFNGLQWSLIATITGAGNSNQNLYYSYTLNDTENAYYRLIQVDYDGTETFLGIAQSNCSVQSDINPFAYLNIYADDNNNIFITFHSSIRDLCQVVLYDINGKVISKWQMNVDEGYNKFQLSVQPVRFAVYFVTVYSSEIVASRKIILK